MKNEESIMKIGKITEELFWKCESCGKEHKLKMLFCDECGAERSDKHFYKNKFREISTNIKAVDWTIMIAAVSLMALFTFGNIALIPWIVLLSIVLAIIAFIRLILCKIIKLWQRFLVLIITIVLNPIVLIIAISFVWTISHDRLRERVNRVDKIELVKACSKIVINPDKYKEKYTDDFSTLPEYIKNIKPAYVGIDEDSVAVKLKYGPAQYAWLFFQDKNGDWNLNSYRDIKQNRSLLMSNIIINTNTGEVIIPK